MYLLCWPVPIEPVAWRPPAAPPLTGAYEPSDALRAVQWLGSGIGVGPEDIALDRDGNMYVGYIDGRIMRFDAAGGQPEELCNTHGRPLGLDFDEENRLIIADGERGLLRFSKAQGLVVLTDGIDGGKFRFVDDVDVARDGSIYFSDASSKFGPKGKARDDIFEHGGHGRLLKYDPATKTTTELLSGLQFANGVAVCPDQSCVLVAQTGSYNVVRYWLTGDKKGTSEIFLDNLPGIPDGISSNGQDRYWIALFAPRNAFLDFMGPVPLLRKIVWRLPAWVQPQPAKHGFVLGVDLEGQTRTVLHDVSPESYHPITSVEQYGDFLYFGSLEQDAFARIPLAAIHGMHPAVR